MGWHVHGALVEYDSKSGSVSNVVVFQFNPESISRTFNFPHDAAVTPDNAGLEEPRQISGSPTESFSVTAYFSVADELGADPNPESPARRFGIGPQLTSLERMVYAPGGMISDSAGASVDAVGDTLHFGDDKDATQPVPRQETPYTLFMWGDSRVLPVKITSMTVDEEKYDPWLNPVQAKATIGLAVVSYPEQSDDYIGMGALRYTQTVLDQQFGQVLRRISETGIDKVSF